MMEFINVLVSGPEQLLVRMWVRDELMRIGLEDDLR